MIFVHKLLQIFIIRKIVYFMLCKIFHFLLNSTIKVFIRLDISALYTNLLNLHIKSCILPCYFCVYRLICT